MHKEPKLLVKKRLPRTKICVIVPAFNEELVIECSLKSLSKAVSKKHIYVVSDGSTDNTVELAKRLVPNVLELKKNVGKAHAIEQLIKNHTLLEKYKYVLFADADSSLEQGFLLQLNPFIAKNPACIVGTVTSTRKGLISAYRAYEYGLTHRIFKQAQDIMKVITVAPGCASLYRSDVLAQLDFSGETLTEDFDLTLQIHKKKLGEILYAPKARVLTQDPLDFKDYWNQITRWYTGFWQNVFLHKLYLPSGRINFEIGLLLLDSFGWILSIGFAIIYPDLFLRLLVLGYLSSCAMALLILTLEKKLWALLYLPLFPLFQFINLSSYILSFFRAITGGNKRLSWRKVARY